MRLALITIFFCVPLLAGCASQRVIAGYTDQLQVYGIELHSAVDYREIAGETASEEPCLKGYERSFDKLDITIGYGFDRKIRRISTRNRGTSIFGITPGMSVAEGRRILERTGFTQESPFRYRLDDVTLTLLVDGAGNLFGLTLESIY